MKITRFLKPNQIKLEVTGQEKREIIETLIRIMVDQGQIAPEQTGEVVESLMERESQVSTGLGYGVALPHVTTKAVTQIEVVFGRSIKGLDFEALDGLPVHFFFLILAPLKRPKEYLATISTISALMKDERFRNQLINCQSTEEIYKVFDQTSQT